jgi:multiple sugar transport system ATP-binding protein
MASVTFKRVEKVFGTVQAVHPLDLEVADGQFLVLLGPSGCGKTTLLRMVAGLEEVTAGNLFIGTRRVNDLPARDRDIAMVFQSYALYPHLTVAENIAFPLRVRGVSKSERIERVNAVAQILGLTSMLERKPRQLSGGQRQRVALGRAMIRDPEVFLFDEPLSNLDAALRDEMRGELIRMHARLGKTVIYVTHDQIEAMTMGERIVVIREGRVQQVASPRELFDRPANLFVASFVGRPKMNFISGRLIPRDDVAVVDVGMGEGPMLGVADRTEREIVIGFRPSDAHIASTVRPGHLGVHVRVASVQPIGTSVIVEVVRPDTGWSGSLETEWRNCSVSPGDVIALEIDPAHVHIFDAQTESRVL